MKKTFRICILSMILIGISIGFYFLVYDPSKSVSPYEVAMETETVPETEAESSELLRASMSVQKNYSYLITEEDGRLIVYYGDGETVYLVSDIRMEDLDQEMQEKVAAGITFENAKELFEFLENYSS